MAVIAFTSCEKDSTTSTSTTPANQIGETNNLLSATPGLTKAVLSVSDLDVIDEQALLFSPNALSIAESIADIEERSNALIAYVDDNAVQLSTDSLTLDVNLVGNSLVSSLERLSAVTTIVNAAKNIILSSTDRIVYAIDVRKTYETVNVNKIRLEVLVFSVLKAGGISDACAPFEPNTSYSVRNTTDILTRRYNICDAPRPTGRGLMKYFKELESVNLNNLYCPPFQTPKYFCINDYNYLYNSYCETGSSNCVNIPSPVGHKGSLWETYYNRLKQVMIAEAADQGGYEAYRVQLIYQSSSVNGLPNNNENRWHDAEILLGEFGFLDVLGPILQTIN